VDPLDEDLDGTEHAAANRLADDDAEPAVHIIGSGCGQKMPHIIRAFFADPDLRYIVA
jgi:hypothetical protein